MTTADLIADIRNGLGPRNFGCNNTAHEALDRLAAELSRIPRPLSVEGVAQLRSKVAEALERDFDAGRAVKLTTLAKHIVERLMLAPQVLDLDALTAGAETSGQEKDQ